MIETARCVILVRRRSYRPSHMHLEPHFDLSILLLYRDDEDVILRAVQSLCAAFANTNTRLEIVPVDLGSGDNSGAIMKIIPTKCALQPSSPIASRSLFGPALEVARGQVLCVLDPAAAIASSSLLEDAYQQVAWRGCDAVQLAPHCMMLRRDRNERAMRSMVGIPMNIHARLTRAVVGSGRSLKSRTPKVSGWPKVGYLGNATQWAVKVLRRTNIPG